MTIYTTFDLTGYSAVSMKIRKPSGTLLTKTPTVSALSTGVLTYETISGDLDEVGDYTVEVLLTYPDGDYIKSELDNFAVYTPLI
jgi:hypothetical protein